MSDAREALVALLHNEGDGGIWEHFDRKNSEAVADAILAAGWTPPGERVKPSVEVGVCEHQNANYLRMMSERDALRAEVERLREVSAAQPYETERELAVALDEAQRQVADLRAGIEALADTKPGATGRALRALLAGSGEQLGEVYGPRPAACCGKCPPIEGGGYDCTCEGNPRCVRERVRGAVKRAATWTEDGPEYEEAPDAGMVEEVTDAVLAVVGQGVTAEQREQAVASLYRMFEAAKAVKGARRAGKTALSRDLQAILAVVRPSGQEGL